MLVDEGRQTRTGDRERNVVASEKGQRKIEGRWEGRVRQESERERERGTAGRRGSERGMENGRVGKGGRTADGEERGGPAEVKTWKCSMAVGNR